jgi:hypothetical protein
MEILQKQSGGPAAPRPSRPRRAKNAGRVVASLCSAPARTTPAFFGLDGQPSEPPRVRRHQERQAAVLVRDRGRMAARGRRGLQLEARLPAAQRRGHRDPQAEGRRGRHGGRNRLTERAAPQGAALSLTERK